MPKMIQIRNVPDDLHRKLKARAAHEGKSLSDYLLEEMIRYAALPSREEFLARLHSRTPVKLRTPAAVIIREGRGSI
jgi:plasmid stability protein